MTVLTANEARAAEGLASRDVWTMRCVGGPLDRQTLRTEFLGKRLTWLGSDSHKGVYMLACVGVTKTAIYEWRTP